MTYSPSYYVKIINTPSHKDIKHRLGISANMICCPGYAGFMQKKANINHVK